MGNFKKPLFGKRAFNHVARGFVRDFLPDPLTYYASQGLKLSGSSATGWKSARCPFHDDSSPSFGVNMQTGGFVCHACGERGGDVLAFHMKRYGLPFVDAAKQLGAWRESSDALRR